MRKNLIKKDFEKILENYSIGHYKSHKKLWWSIKNTLYLLKTNKGEFIVKIYEYSEGKDIEWILKIMEKLRTKNIPLSKIFKTNKKKLIFNLHKPLVIQKYINGKEIKKEGRHFVIEFAKTLGKIDKELMKVKITKKHTWEKFDSTFKPTFYRSGKIIEDFNFDKSEKELLREFNKKVKKSNLRKSVIHGDFQLNNLIVKNGKIKAVIDWDDMHEAFIVDEVAIAINHLFFTFGKVDKKYIPNFFKEYEKWIKLNYNEKMAIYFLIKKRILDGITWCDLSRKEHKEKHKKLTRWLKRTIKSYKEFNKLSLEDFLDLIKH